MQGEASQPHLRVTPLGTLRAAWLSPQEVATAPLPASGVGVVGISGFGDFQPHLAAASLNQHGVNAEAQEIDLPLLDVLRDSPSEFRAANIARRLDDETQWPALLAALRPLAQRHVSDHARLLWPRRRSPVPVAAAAPALPAAPAAYAAAVGAGDAPARPAPAAIYPGGGTWLTGDEVIDISHRNGSVNAIWTRNHGDIPLRPRFAVLASGSFFSNGLVADAAACASRSSALTCSRRCRASAGISRTFCLSALAAFRPENRCGSAPAASGADAGESVRRRFDSRRF
jgi:glycerol-3-phosphate dehydrogenase subunit B